MKNYNTCVLSSDSESHSCCSSLVEKVACTLLDSPISMFHCKITMYYFIADNHV